MDTEVFETCYTDYVQYIKNVVIFLNIRLNVAHEQEFLFSQPVVILLYLSQ